MEATRKILGRLALSAAMIGFTVGAMAAPVAAKPRANTTTDGGGSCSATATTVGQSYAVVGTALGANRLVNLYITDPGGTQWGSVMTDATGRAQYSGVAGWAGSYSVKITDSGRKPATLAMCAFSVG